MSDEDHLNEAGQILLGVLCQITQEVVKKKKKRFVLNRDAVIDNTLNINTFFFHQIKFMRNK